MTNPKIQGEVEFVTTQAEEALGRVTQRGEEMGTSLVKAGEKADTSTKQVAQSYGRIEAEIRRVTAAVQAQAEGTGKVGEILNKAVSQGLDVSRFDTAVQKVQQYESQISVAAAAERNFIATKAFEQKANEAAKLNKASEYVRFWEESLKKAEEAERRLATQNGFLGSLKSQVDGIGKSKADLLEMQAAQLGVATSAAPFIAKLRETEKGMNTLGMSSKQFAANMRGVPAQFTDIITSLQGGQRPLTVLLQQGGQLKDMFGGAGNAAKALGGYVLGLLNPYTLAAGAVGALALAYYQGRRETEAYNKALIMSGNVAGTSAGQLSEIAKSIAGSGNTSVGSVASALAEIAATGKISADVIGKVAKAAVDMEKVGGAAASETVKEFAALGDSPVAAILKLNDKYHFLTESVYSQIRALEEQGRVTDAANAAQLAYADAIEGRVPAMVENLGFVEKAWKGISGAAKGAWDFMLNVGREKTLDQKLAEAIGKRDGQYDYSAKAIIKVPGQEKIIAQLEAEIESRDRQSRMAGADQQREKEAIAGSQSLDALKKNLRTKEELIADSNKKIARDAAAVNAVSPGKYSDADIAKLQKAEADRINGPAKKASGGSVAPVDKSQLAFDLAQIKQATDEQVGMYSNAEKVMQAMRSANLIEEGDYYEAKAAFIRLNSEAQEADLQKQIDRLSREKLSGKDKIDNDRKALELEQKLAKLRADTAAGLKVNAIQAEAANKRIQQSFDDARSSADAYLATIAKQNQRSIEGLGKGNEYRSEQAVQSQIEDRLTSRRTTLDDDLRRRQITKEEYATYLGIAEDTYNKEVAMHADAREKILAKQSDWKTGMSEALANYADSARNVAEQTEKLFTNAFGNMEDALVDFVKTGKLDFKSLMDSIIADMARAAIQQNITGPLSGWLSGLFSSPASGTGGSFANGGVFSSPSLSAYSGGVYNSPHFFKFASGAGVFGEAGPEAIMPLKRGPDGKLGVASASSVPEISVVINNTVSDQAQATAQPRMNNGKLELEVMIEKVLSRDMQQNGRITQGFSNTFGLARAV